MPNKNPIYTIVLKIIKKGNSLIRNDQFEMRNWKMFSNKEYSNELIYEKLLNENPCMIARLGSNELESNFPF